MSHIKFKQNPTMLSQFRFKLTLAQVTLQDASMAKERSSQSTSTLEHATFLSKSRLTKPPKKKTQSSSRQD
jgi:hypothetical protein